MTIHEMMHQVALLSGGVYRKERETSMVEIPIPGGRKQRLYARLKDFDGEQVGLFHADVGPLGPGIDLLRLLEINAHLRYSRVAVLEGNRIVVQALVELDRTTVRECAPVLQEIGAAADELERLHYGHDQA